jgi:hypothetical protein
LEEICDAPFWIFDADIPVLNTNPIDEDSIQLMFDRVPRWNAPTPPDGRFLHTVRSARNSVVERGRYIASGSYGAAFAASFVDRDGTRFDDCVMKVIPCVTAPIKRQAMVEMCIHAIVSHTCRADEYIRDRQLRNRMTKIPNLLAAFVVDGPNVEWREQELYETASDARTRPFFVYVMERTGTSRFGTFLSSIRDDTDALNTSVASSMYQLTGLFLRLGELIQFNHRDCHSSNVMIEQVDGVICGGTVPNFQTCLIDFGYARVTYRGRSFLGNSDVFYPANSVQDFKDGHDIVMFAWSVRNSLGCIANTTYPCAYLFPRSLDLVMRTMMNSTGINFNTNLYDKLTTDLYKALTYAGEPDQLSRIVFHYKNVYGHTIGHYPVLTDRVDTIDRRKFSNLFARQCMVLVLRICRIRCAASSLTRTERDNITRIEYELSALMGGDSSYAAPYEGPSETQV